jgi:hypothetical protein
MLYQSKGGNDEGQLLAYSDYPLCSSGYYTITIQRTTTKGLADWLTPCFFGAGNGIRTRDFNLGKVALYH